MVDDVDADILAFVTALTGDLSPAHGTSIEELQKAHRAAIDAYKTGQKRSATTDSQSPVTFLSADNSSSLKSLLAEESATPVTNIRVQRRGADTDVRINPLEPVYESGGQVISQSLGPFVDSEQRTIRVDVITAIPLIGLQWVGATQPFLFISLTQLTGTSRKIVLDTGSVWIPATQLATSAPASSFVGLGIQSGEIGFETPINLSARPILIPSPSLVQVFLKVKPVASIPGADFQAILPQNIHLTFNTTGGSLVESDNAEIKFFSTSDKLSFQPGPARYAADFSRIEFTFKSQRASLSFAQDGSQMVHFSGKSRVDSAQWSLPITRASPDALGAVEGGGGLSLKLSSGLVANVKDTQLTISCGFSMLLVEPERLFMSSQLAIAANFPRPLPSGLKTTASFRTSKAFPLLYVKQMDTTEAFSLQASITVTLDQPRNIVDERLRFTTWGTVIKVRKQDITKTTYGGDSTVPRPKLLPQSYAIKNLVLGSSDPLNLRTNISEIDGSPPTVSTTVEFDLRFILLILPDPYTSNFPLSIPPPNPQDPSSTGTLRVLISWGPSSQPTLDISFVPVPANVTGSLAAHNLLLPAIERSVANEFKASNPFLLDVSTNISQFGVLIGGKSEREVDAPPPVTSSISGLTFNLPGTFVQLATLPPVQWEPLYTPAPMLTADGSPFPNPLTYADSGRLTEFSTNSVELIPISPREVLDSLVSRYNSDNTNVVEAQFTLPFGIQASATLAHPGTLRIEAPGLATVQPRFQPDSMAGGDQLSLKGSRGRVVIGPRRRLVSRSFSGSATQLRNALNSSGNLTSVTAISTANSDVITDPFNQTFGPGAETAKVPVTRIDISGFGESMFSDWRFVDDSQGAAISKVQFDVLVGRTAREVVQLTSTLYPFAARFVRTITIHRLNTGVVIREEDDDSGWSAVSDGHYVFPSSTAVTQPIITHPGVVKAVLNIRNIRDLSRTTPVTVSGGIELVGVRFDCTATIENTVGGQSLNGVPARDMLGYVQKTPGPPLNALQYQELLSKVGALGGLVDCTINAGGSGQLMRVNQIGVGASQKGTDIQFAMAGWGAPIFLGGGQWSFLTIQGTNSAPTTVGHMGIPLIQQNPSGTPPQPQPYRFADPHDLLGITNQSANYCLCHATGTQKLLFPLPVIEPRAPWAFTSVLPPFLADSYAMGTSIGPFPRLETCIRFNNADYQLFIDTSGNLRLQLEPNSSSTSFTPAMARRILLESETSRSVAFTGDENGNPSQVTIVIDTASHIPWSLEIANVSLISEIPSMGEGNADPRASEISRLVGTVRSAANLKTEITDKPRVVFGPALKPVKDALAFFEQFGPLIPMTISMTNSWTFWGHLDLDLEKLIARPGTAAVFLKKFFDKLELKIDVVQHTDKWISYSRHKFTMRVKFPAVGIYVVTLLGAFEYYAGSDGKNYTLQIGGGVGADLSFSPFVAFGFIEVTVVGMMGDHTWGIGGSVIISAHIDYKIVSVQASVEARHMYMVTDCTTPRETTKWGLTQVLVAIEIHIFWVVDIDYHSRSEWKVNYNGGRCPMEINSNTKNVGTPS
jgi:hypothetical protein